MTAMDANEKSTAQHIDTIGSSQPSEQGVQVRHVNDANEEIVQHLQTTGEEVGMTWRSIMAAIVSFLDPNIASSC
jgi:ribosomal protein S16